MSGRVRQVPVVAGGAVSGGMLAVSLQTDDRPRVYALVPSEQLARIAIGHRATVYVPALSRELDANVVSVEPRIWSLPENVRRLFGNPSDGGLVVLSFLPDEQEVATLHPGLPVTVEMGSEGSRHGVQSVSNMLGVSKSQAATVPVHAVK
jgi:HlyD family secretion protein